MKYLLFKIGIMIGIAVFLTACYPGGAEYTSDTDLVVTDYNPDYDFGDIHYYYLSDSINHIVEEDDTPDRTLDPFVIGLLEDQLNALGWERSTDTITDPEPDVSIVVAAIIVTNYNIYQIPWYGGWGYGWGWYYKGTDYWGYPGYGWGYPYYGYTYVTSYDVGTLAWFLFEPDKVDIEDELIYMEWAGVINGVLGLSTSSTEDRIERGIDQAFNQSSYLSGE